MPNRRTRRKKGGKCEYKKGADGKWKNVCTKTKKNFSTSKTSLSDSKKAFAERKEAKKNMAKVDKLEKDLFLNIRKCILCSHLFCIFLRFSSSFSYGFIFKKNSSFKFFVKIWTL